MWAKAVWASSHASLLGRRSSVRTCGEEGRGEESLKVELKGPGINRQPLVGHVSNSEEPPEERRGFQVDANLVQEGQKLFTKTLGIFLSRLGGL